MVRRETCECGCAAWPRWRLGVRPASASPCSSSLDASATPKSAAKVVSVHHRATIITNATSRQREGELSRAGNRARGLGPRTRRKDEATGQVETSPRFIPLPFSQSKWHATDGA
jgi:hypothetical protein